jgi:hypothetical protein
MTTRHLRLSVLVVAVSCISALAGAQDQPRFKADLQTTGSLGPALAGRCDDAPGHAPVIGLLTVQGAGDATFLGPVIDEQSHCLRADLSFFNGQFTLTSPNGHKVWGRYFGHLVPTVTSITTVNGPAGQWLILGNVCLEGATNRPLKDDCAEGRYQPARGLTNPSTGDATIFIDQRIHLGR